MLRLSRQQEEKKKLLTAANELTLPVGDRVFYRLSIRGDKRDHSQKDEKITLERDCSSRIE